MRELTSHKAIGPVNAKLQVQAIGELSLGGAPMRYDITGFDASTNPARLGSLDPKIEHGDECNPVSRLPLIFQSGEPGEVGFNGITMEALLAVIEDRLAHFQQGPYPCPENDLAREYVLSAIHALEDRAVRLTKEAGGEKVTTSATT